MGNPVYSLCGIAAVCRQWYNLFQRLDKAIIDWDEGINYSASNAL